jgi:hypothetical protein
VLLCFVRETLNKSAFYGEPAQLCDAGINKINALTRLILPQKFPHLFNQRFLRLIKDAGINDAQIIVVGKTAKKVISHGLECIQP